MGSSRLFRKQVWLSIASCIIASFFGCSAQQMAAPDCNCTPQKAAIDEISIHTLQSSRFSIHEMLSYLQGKCFTIDSSMPRIITSNFTCSPVIICDIPGYLEFFQLNKEIGVSPISEYGFSTNINFVDSVSRSLGLKIPSSITTNEALRDTFAHRIHTFGGLKNDSIALYWHGIYLGWHPSGFVDIEIRDSTWWAKTVLQRYDKQTGP
jgi:hypothetical protein